MASARFGFLHQQENEGAAGKNDIHLVNWRELGKLLQR
jgi:hypothetical protein